MKYSLIIPVYNRPEEVDELLQSLVRQTCRDFEVVVVEDGSTIPCDAVVNRYANLLALKYYVKPNEGPGKARNYGAMRSQGEYLLVLDSDCVLPPDYLEAVGRELAASPSDAFGGPDRAHDSFSPVQKAINYSMTSFFTTGGIRGGRRQMDKKFYPRSFNMGIRAEVYRSLGGFSDMRFGEDIDFSIRIYRSGASCRLFPEAWVWHKRRTDMRKFFKQVFNSGMARINLTLRHPGTLKVVHLLPAAFTIVLLTCLLLALTGIGISVAGLIAGIPYDGDGEATITSAGVAMMVISLLPQLLFSVTILADSSIRNKSLKIGLLSVIASYIQLVGYGMGFMSAWWRRCVCGGRTESQAFRNSFYS